MALFALSSAEQLRLVQPLSPGMWSSALGGTDVLGDPAAQDMGEYKNFLHGT